MKATVLLVARKKNKWNKVIARAVERTGRALRPITSSKDAFAAFRGGLFRVDVVVVDLDPGIHGMAMLEALAACENRPPIIAVTGLEESDMTPIAHRHGATACIGEPFTAEEFAELLDNVCPEVEPADTWSSDQWGHPHRHRRQITRPAVASGAT